MLRTGLFHGSFSVRFIAILVFVFSGSRDSAAKALPSRLKRFRTLHTRNH